MTIAQILQVRMRNNDNTYIKIHSQVCHYRQIYRQKIQNGMDTLIISNECSLLYNLYYDMPVINNIHSKH